ncbi:MAG: cadherin-like domain-containing protein [Chloroflexota bacterium]
MKKIYRSIRLSLLFITEVFHFLLRMTAKNILCKITLIPLFAFLLMVLFLRGAMTASLSALNMANPVHIDMQQIDSILIPQSESAIIVDGVCTEAAYEEAIIGQFQSISDSLVTFYLVHVNQTLYVCIQGDSDVDTPSLGIYRVYLDTDGGREAIATPDDLALEIDFSTPPVLKSLRGHGLKGEFAASEMIGWQATSNATELMAEYAISFSLLEDPCDRSFGLAVYHYLAESSTQAYGWPHESGDYQPSTWAVAELEDADCTQPPVAMPQMVTTTVNTPILIQLENLDANNVMIESPARAGHGALETSGAGFVTYYPDFNFKGSDSFDFSLIDDRDNRTSATVSITVRPEPKPANGLRFFDGQNRPIANDEVWVLCYSTDPTQGFVDNLLLQTDGNGVPLTPLPTECDQVAALRLRLQQPAKAGKSLPAYRVYSTSWRTGSGTPDIGSATCAPACPATDKVIIRDEWPLILFDVAISLEWTADDPIFESDLANGLHQASANLADLTDGYMAFGLYTISEGGENWNVADLRLHAANDLRPLAFVGGIVTETVSYTTGSPYTKTDGTTDNLTVNFAPAAAYFGRAWDGNNGHTGKWSDAEGFRTIVHEWLHYALFLYDEYGHTVIDETTGNPRTAYCTCSILSTEPGSEGKIHFCYENDMGDSQNPASVSAMAFHYHASELWHNLDSEEPDGACTNSAQYAVHSEADWQTLEKWYQIQGLDPASIGIAPLRSPSNGPLGESALTPSAMPTVRAAASLDSWGPLNDLFNLEPAISLPPTQTQRNLYLPIIRGEATDQAEQTIALQQSVGNEKGLSSRANDLSISVVSTIPITVANTAAQLYLFEYKPTQGLSRIVHQGTGIIGNDAATENFMGKIVVLGDLGNDRVRLFVDRYTFTPTVSVSIPHRFIFSSTQELGIIMDPMEATPNHWGSSLDLDYEMQNGVVSTMTVVLSGRMLTDNNQPTVQICVPDSTQGCLGEYQMQLDSQGHYTAEIDFTKTSLGAVPPYGIVRITHPELNFDGLVRWFRDGGGVGPAHNDVNAPKADGLVTVELSPTQALDRDCSRVMIMPAAHYPALQLPMVSGLDIKHKNGKLVGMPLDVDILAAPPNGACQDEDKIDNDFQAGPAKITLFYNQEAITRLGLTELDEQDLTIIRYNREAGGMWETTGLMTAVDTNLNLVSAEGIVWDGIYAIVWPGTP